MKEHPVIVGATSIGSAAFAGLTAAEWAAVFCALLNLCLLIGWLWRHIGRAFFIRMGWIKGVKRDFMASTDLSRLDDGHE